MMPKKSLKQENYMKKQLVYPLIKKVFFHIV